MIELSELPELSVRGRTGQIREAMSSNGVDAAWITSRSNVRWCTGFTGSNAAVAITSDRAVLVTDGRYSTQAPAELAANGSDAEVAVVSDLHEEGRRLLASAATVGLEPTIAWGAQLGWAEHHHATLVAMTDMVEVLRSVKDDAEIARMQAAASIVDDALAAVRDELVVGATERQIARRLDDEMRDRGAQGPAYETIVASGPNSALPHARPTSRRFDRGDLVVIDAGALVDGYRSDMTRTFVVGSAEDQHQRLLDAVTRSQAAGVSAVRPDVEAGAIDDVCRSLLTEEGLGDRFVHGTGHGVGLDIHELPRVRKGSTAILRPGHVLTVEPGVYIPDLGGVRVEDCVVVTADGCRSLTRFPKDPVVS